MPPWRRHGPVSTARDSRWSPRNLARRAADAAGDITNLIDDSVTRIREGHRVAGEVGEALGSIAERVNNVSELIANMSKATKEQADGVEQVNLAVTRLEGVTQQNASASEESAAAAEELAAQSHLVTETVERLRILVGATDRH
jgi:methyl-accepting chemotaxis protein